MTREEIHSVSTIVERYTRVNSLAKQAEHAISIARHEFFANLTDSEDEEVIYKAIEILRKIQNKTSFYNAVSYYDGIQKEQQP